MQTLLHFVDGVAEAQKKYNLRSPVLSLNRVRVSSRLHLLILWANAEFLLDKCWAPDYDYESSLQNVQTRASAEISKMFTVLR